MSSITPILVVVTGHPCSGKTTVSRHIAQRFRLPLMSKDTIKESLFDTLGWSNREWSKQVGRSAIELLFRFADAMLSAGCSCIIESNFHQLDAERFRVLQGSHEFRIIQINCSAVADVLFQRFEHRAFSGERHPGHCDQESLSEFRQRLLSDMQQPLTLEGPFIEIDSSNAVDYPTLIADLERCFRV